MKVGDLVKHKGSLGMGIITGLDPRKFSPDEKESKVYPAPISMASIKWLWDNFTSVEFSDTFEVVSEER